MAVARKNASGSPRFRRGLSPWFLLTGVGLMTIGLLYFRPSPKATKANPKSAKGEAYVKPVSKTSFGTSASIQVDSHSSHRFVSNDPFAASLDRWLQRINAQADPMAREKLMGKFLASVDVTNIPAALAVLQSAQPTALAADLSQRLIRRWTKGDPQAAAVWVEALPAGTARQRGLENVAIVWANDNVTNAINWAQSLADDRERSRTIIAVAWEAVRSEPVKALELAIKLPANAKRDELVRRAATEWASRDAPNAVAWAKQIPDTRLRAQVLAGEAMAWASRDPRAAAEVAVNELPEGRLQKDTVMSIVERWAQRQPEAAAAWVEQFPEGKLKQNAKQYLTELSHFQP